MTDILSVLIWVQTVCKSYLQTTKVATDKERFKVLHVLFTQLDRHPPGKRINSELCKSDEPADSDLQFSKFNLFSTVHDNCHLLSYLFCM